MITRSSEMPREVVANLRNGIGSVEMFHFLNEEVSGGAGRMFAKQVIEPGNSIGYHQHVGEMETYYIIKGKGLVSDNGAESVLEAGDCLVCRDGCSHSIKNVGDDTLEFIAIILHTKQKEIK